VEKLTELLNQVGHVGTAVYSIFAHLPLRVQKILRSFSLPPSFLIPLAAGPDAPQPLVRRTVHENQVRAEIVPPGFEEDGSVHHDGRHVSARSGVGDLFGHAPADSRVHHSVQRGKLIGIGKHDSPQRLSIDASPIVEDAPAPPLAKLPAHGFIGEQFVADLIRVDQRASEACQFRSRSALARAHAPDDADDRFVRGR